MIQILEGKTVVYKLRLLTENDGELELGTETEKHLVEEGAARYAKRVETGHSGEAGSPPMNAPAGDESGAKGSLELKPAYSLDMKAPELIALMTKHELPFRAGMTKVAMVAALDAFFDGGADDGQVDDGEALPVLGAEEPVT